MAVKIIPAQLSAPSTTETKKKRRVAAYCRVSTDNEEQESSFDAQVTHYTDYITSNPDWELAGIYADEGLSGGSTKKRERFNAMIADCEDHKIDLVLTKSISRFARNTLDCLNYIRKLKDLNIPILFEKENILTTDASGEMLITIMASLAQQESESISRNIRMGIQYRFQQGKPMTSNRLMGYRNSKDKTKLEIEPEQAVVIRRMFREFLDGMSASEIAEGLMADGVPTAQGKEKWHQQTITFMLQNEKYMGDLLLQKTYIQDFMSKKSIRNDGKFPKYYVERAHEPIVPREVFMLVKGEYLRREKIKEASGNVPLIKGSLVFTKKIECCRCGNTYKRFKKDKPQLVTWRCKTRAQPKTPCHGRIIKELALQDDVVKALNTVPLYKSELERMAQISPDERELDRQIRELDARDAQIHEQATHYAETGVLDTRDYGISSEVSSKHSDNVEDALAAMKEEQDQIEAKRNALLMKKAEYARKRIYASDLLDLIQSMTSSEDGEPLPYMDEIQRQLRTYPAKCEDLEDFYARTSQRRHFGPVTKFDPKDVVQYIKKIVVYDESLKFIFRAGIEIEIQD